MQDKPLDRAELDLLATLVRLDAERGPVPRAVLSVEARGRGLEFGRAFGRLRALGLIEEVERRPFFLFRLFGARSSFVLHLTPAGRQISAGAPVLAAPPQDMTEGLPEAVVPSQGAGPVPVMPALPEGTAPGPVPVTAQPEGRAAAEAALAPSAVVSPPADAAHEAQPDLTAPGTAPVKPVKRTRRPPVTGFTEDLGGVPEAATPRRDADPAVVQALREVLGGLGMDLTLAGEMLVADRMAKGARAAEALLQVVVYAFAHVIQHDLLLGRSVEAMGLADYAADVRREMQKLADAGEIGAERFAFDMGQFDTLIQDAAARGAMAEMLLADPFGGAAPPAVLPEDLWQRLETSPAEVGSPETGGKNSGPVVLD